MSDSPPGARRGAIAVYSSQEDAVFMWGGLQLAGSIFDQGGQFEGYPSELWRFDPAERIWEIAEVGGEVPIGREDPTYFWDDASGSLYLFHGFNKTLTLELQLSDDAYVLHLAERRWERLEILGDTPEPRWRASSVLDPSTGHGWLFGGWQDFGTTMLSDLWRFDPDSNRWIRGCTLAEQP